MSKNPFVQIEGVSDVLLVVLYAGGKVKVVNEEIVGTTRLVKMMFILAKETSFRQHLQDRFVASENGPYSKEVLDAIVDLIDQKFVSVVKAPPSDASEEADRYRFEAECEVEGETPKETVVYSLTQTGKGAGSVLYESLDDHERTELNVVKKRFNAMDIKLMVNYIKDKYPGFVKK